MLTPKQQRFVEEYLVDFNGSAAYRRAGYAARGNAAEVNAARLLRNAKVQQAIAAGQAALSERTEITQEMVLERWWKIATADPNDLIQYRRVCCRHCHGKGFEYQWLDEAEFRAALVKFMEYKGDAPRERPKDDGGYGYSKLAEVRADCPKCFGEGIEGIYAADTRKLKGASRLLYAGVKVTRDGLEIKMRDQDAAMANVARHLGMFKDKLELEVSDDLASVLAAARERAIASRG
jgi:phage terminase small subunit